MKLVSLLSERRVLPEIKAETQWEALDECVDHLVSTGHLPAESREAVLRALHEREEQVSTGIGYGVAIPHAYCEQLERPLAVLARSGAGLEFDAPDNAPVHVVILLLVPSSQSQLHLQTLASIAELFSRSGVRKRVREAGSAREILVALGHSEAEAA